jgi:undecaprenyl pyrophosphate phosphatase UppP
MRKLLNKIINSKALTYLLELVLPTILSILLTVYMDNKYDNSRLDISDTDLITIPFIILFYFIVVIEWYRRFKTKDSKYTFEKYLYIGVVLFVFMLGIWYINSMFSE